MMLRDLLKECVPGDEYDQTTTMIWTRNHSAMTNAVMFQEIFGNRCNRT